MAEILTKSGASIILDDVDFDRFKDRVWCIGEQGYAKSKAGYLHRLILGLQKGDGNHVDHVNGNRLDNRRCNLRVCTRAQNLQNQGKNVSNTSGFKGVSWIARDRHWRAQIRVNGRRIYLGAFQDVESAHRAYVAAAEKFHGEFSRTA